MSLQITQLTEAPERKVKKPPGSNNGRQYLQPDLMGTLCSRDHWG